VKTFCDVIHQNVLITTRGKTGGLVT